MSPFASAWSELHELALVYLALLYSGPARPPGGPFSEGPRDARLRLGERYSDVSEERLEEVFHDAFLMYVGVMGSPMLDVTVASLRQSLPRAQRLAVLGDLAGLASADGTEDLPPSGRSFIQYLAARWNLEPAPGRPE